MAAYVYARLPPPIFGAHICGPFLSFDVIHTAYEP
jgi:hypothetical protein